MDAKIGDWVVTPRQGKAVEINALWHNALCVMESFSRKLKNDERTKFYQQLVSVIQVSFNRVFWNAEAQCLFDCIQDGVPDKKIRPNQIFAVSLPHPLLPSDRAEAVVRVVKERLLTPYGLRSLAPDDPDYRPFYRGNGYERDSAYHQGTVWAWLIGPFVDAYLNVFGESEENCRHLKSLFEGFRQHLSEAMLGSIRKFSMQKLRTTLKAARLKRGASRRCCGPTKIGALEERETVLEGVTGVCVRICERTTRFDEVGRRSKTNAPTCLSLVTLGAESIGVDGGSLFVVHNHVVDLFSLGIRARNRDRHHLSVFRYVPFCRDCSLPCPFHAASVL